MGSARGVLRNHDAAARSRDLRRRTRRGARRAAGLDARVRGDRRRCARGVPDGGAVSGSATLVCAHFSQFAERVALGAGQLRAGHEPPRRARSGEPSVQPRIGCGLHRRARAPVTLREAAGRPGGAGRTCRTRSRAARVRSPVGLSLGAETPEEVAVSILGEMLAIRRGFDGGFLSGSVAAFTAREDRRLLASS